ncbi:GTA TIM barrel-like domain protein [Rhodobacter phage RcDormio]|nr:GTA TIM barrel-like domain protein [Rhodobacter phage RcDormio]
MATLVLGAIGSAIGSGFGGAILGFSGAAIGGFIGSTVGSVVDSWIVGSMMPNQRIEGARLESLRVTSSSEGAAIPRIFGRMRVGGNLIWATDFTETQKTESQGGGKGGGGGVTTTTYLYSASFAVALCEGPITGIGRIWADGKPMDMTGVTMRAYFGTETQTPDPLIVAKVGADNTPAYRGLAYVVFDTLPLENFGNRIPQLTFEVFSPLADADTAEGLTRAVTMIPASGEFAYATEVVLTTVGATTNVFGQTSGGTTKAENSNAVAGSADFVESLDRMEALAPAVESVSLVVSWFGDDLRCGSATVKPKVEVPIRASKPEWRVGNLTRSSYGLVSTVDSKPAFGGTPSDASVVQAIQELSARGKRVTFYPFVMMDVPAGNTLPNPYSNNAATVGQPVYPWRGRITCSPAAGFTGTVDKTGAAATQVAAFFGNASPAQFSVSGTTVTYTGPGSEWGYRRMILHYAKLCAAVGGVDAFLIGSELRGLTQIRSGASTYPAVAALQTLAADVSAILGPSVKVGYAADWSEYFGHQPADGTNDVFFHLDPLWADANVDFVGIDNYMPISDWRDGFNHLDAAIWPSIYDKGYLQSNIAGGEGFDWFYASDADRSSQIRTPITDGAGKPWVFRYKDLRSWWLNQHYNRPGGVESGSPTAWVPQSKPFRFTELGCPAVDRGTNQPNVFVDPKSSESFYPYFSRGYRDDAIQRAYLEAVLDFWNQTANNPTSGVYGGQMVTTSEAAVWTWDARPYPFYPELTDVWSDSANWTLGHWLTGRLGAVSLAALVRKLAIRAGFPSNRIDVSDLYGAVEGFAIAALETPRNSISVLARHFGFDGFETDGNVRFVMRGRVPSATLTPDDMIASDDAKGESFELTRQQVTDLPLALKWATVRSDEDYDSVMVEARRITVDSARTSSESFPVAVPPEESERRCRRALFEAWVGIEGIAFALPPSRMALDPTDVILFDHDGRQAEFRLQQVADEATRRIDAIRQDRFAYDLPPGKPRPTSLIAPANFGPAEVEIMDIPQLKDTIPAYQPYIAGNSSPWPGSLAVVRSPTLDGFTLQTTINRRATMGRLVNPVYAGPTSRFDLGNEILIDVTYGTLASVTDDLLFGGANAFALESSPGSWEILQAGVVELVSSKRYRLKRLLRGQKGTEHRMGNPTAAGARIVALDLSVYPIPIADADVGIPFNWRIGPSPKPITDDSYIAEAFTPGAEGLRPYAPDVFLQPYRRSRSTGDFLIEWVRRDRALVADNWDDGEPPMSEASEAYDVEILSGAMAVLRTLTSTTPSVLYTGAMQTADFGSLLTIGSTLNVRIFQKSARLGRGAGITKTLFF